MSNFCGSRLIIFKFFKILNKKTNGEKTKISNYSASKICYKYKFYIISDLTKLIFVNK